MNSVGMGQAQVPSDGGPVVNAEESVLDSIEDAVQAIANGELVVVVDDTDRENEGDLIMAAGKATPEKIAFMIRHTSGILCVPMSAERARKLHLEPMVADNSDPMRTAFKVSVDYLQGMTTGISATERAATVNALANDNVVASDFTRPGHIFPLISRSGGVLTRSGHTEAGTDLAALAGCEPAGVLAEIVNDDGTLKRLPELLVFAKEHGLKIVSIEDLIAYRIRTQKFIRRIEDAPVTIRGMGARMYSYASDLSNMHHMVLVFGEVQAGDDIPCRIYREQPIDDLVGRLNGARNSMDTALEEIAANGGRGIVMVVRNPKSHDLTSEAAGEGDAAVRGDGTDLAPEAHQSALDRKQRWREIGIGAQILRDLGVQSIALITTSKRQFVGLGGFGIAISSVVRLNPDGSRFEKT